MCHNLSHLAVPCGGRSQNFSESGQIFKGICVEAKSILSDYFLNSFNTWGKETRIKRPTPVEMNSSVEITWRDAKIGVSKFCSGRVDEMVS